MKTEYVVICLDSNIFGCNVDDYQRKVINLTNTGLYYSDRVITCQITEVINILGRKYGDIRRFELLDFECLDRQIRQSVEYCENNLEEWSPYEMVQHYTGREFPVRPEEQYEETLRLLTDCYLEIKSLGKDEWSRIQEIEIPVNQVLYELVARGIGFRHDLLEELCRQQHKKLYRSLNRIQLDYGQVTPNLETICTNLDIPVYYLKYGNLKVLCKKYPQIQPFREVEKAKRNLKMLTYLSAIRKGINFVSPVIKPFGTRTSRIILREPALQNMSKEFRGLLDISSQTFCEFRYLYVDYSQFEAGILAGLTNNYRLINLYEQEKIYSEIEKILGCNRQEAKIHFYCFIYGGKCNTQLKTFFDKYCSEVELKKLIKSKVSSLFGNNRIFDLNTDGDKILNHIIQSTGSLIFKQALIDVYKCYRLNVELVLPLHDGALYKIAGDEIEDEDILRIYREAFRKWFQNLTPIVKTQQFFPIV